MELPKLNTENILNDIVNTGEFKSDFGRIKEWASYKDPKLKDLKDNLLLGDVSNDDNRYVGLFNHNLERDYIGLQKYKNGDIYLGQWEKNNKNGLGVYLFNSESGKQRQRVEMFLGKFKNGLKEKEGVYVWIEEKLNNNDLMEANFEAYVGEIEEEGFKRGIYLTKLEKIFYIYYGAFTDGNQKNDNKCYFYDNNGEIDRVFKGKIEHDKVKEGFFITFFKEEIDDTAYLKFGEEGIPNEVSTKEMLGEKLTAEINSEAFNFREILYEEDWFGLIYETSKEAYKLLKTNKMEDFDIEKSFNQIIKVIGSYKNITLYPKLCVKMSK